MLSGKPRFETSHKRKLINMIESSIRETKKLQGQDFTQIPEHIKSDLEQEPIESLTRDLTYCRDTLQQVKLVNLQRAIKAFKTSSKRK